MASKPAKTAVKFSDVLAKLPKDELQFVIDAVEQENGEYKLDAETRALVGAELGVEKEAALSWETVSDVLSHYNLYALSQKHPDAAKTVAVTVLDVIALWIGPVSAASTVVKAMPSERLAKIMGLPLMATPDHLANVLVTNLKNRKQALLQEYAADEPAAQGRAMLAVVCKDDRLYVQLEKLVNAEDDAGETVGTQDGTVQLVRWTEQKWRYRYAMGTVGTKVLLLGKLKETDALLAEDAVHFREYGICYGWKDGIAVLQADARALKSRQVYAEFLSRLAELEVPEKVKKDFKFKFDLKTGLKAALATPLLAKDLYDTTVSVERQMYFYGLTKLYRNDLEAFMKEKA